MSHSRQYADLVALNFIDFFNGKSLQVIVKLAVNYCLAFETQWPAARATNGHVVGCH